MTASSPDWTALADTIRCILPGSRLVPLSDGDMPPLRLRHPELPHHYFAYLKHIGWGTLGTFGFVVYQGPMAPHDIYDGATAKELPGVLFIGDNFGGWMLGLDTEGRLVGYDSLSRTPELLQERTVYEFIVDWISSAGAQ